VAAGFLVLVAAVAFLLVQQHTLSLEIGRLQDTPTVLPASPTATDTPSPTPIPTPTPTPRPVPRANTPTPVPSAPLVVSPLGDVIISCATGANDPAAIRITNNTDTSQSWTYTDSSGPSAPNSGWGIGTTGNANPVPPRQYGQVSLSWGQACCNVPVPKGEQISVTWYNSASADGPPGATIGTTTVICKEGQ
jgi:hypothetical protein